MIRRIFLLALFFCVILGWTSWLFRYDIVSPAGIGAYPGSYVLDRWTGRIYLTMPHFRTQTGIAGIDADLESSVPVLTRRVDLRYKKPPETSGRFIIEKAPDPLAGAIAVPEMKGCP